MKFKLKSTKLLIPGLLCTMVCFQAISAQAQVVRIQQPIVQQFSAGTTVTVPDRGTALLGGVSSGRIGSRSFGPLRPGSIYGQDFQSSTSSVGVYIHDFAAMDRMLLNSAPRVLRESDTSNSTLHWQRQLLNQSGSRFVTDTSKQKAANDSRARAQAKAKRFYQLGQQAEQKHATPNIAILHYRAAAKYGSLPAQQRLTELQTETAAVSKSD